MSSANEQFNNAVACGLPDAPDAIRRHTPTPSHCQESSCPAEYVVIPYIPPCCESPAPMFAPSLTEVQCHPVSCEPSVPHELPCPPKVTGWGAYDGGMKHWHKRGKNADCTDACDTGLFDQMSLDPRYVQQVWESFMDMNTGDELWGNMVYFRGHQLAHMTPQVFIALAHKIALLQHMFGLIVHPAEIPVSSKMGLQYVTIGEDSNGNPVYGLSLAYDGKPIGAPMPLTVERDAQGVVTGVRLPHAPITAAEQQNP